MNIGFRSEIGPKMDQTRNKSDQFRAKNWKFFYYDFLGTKNQVKNII